jgi:pyruvate/2-oxoglutarate/acetoin dehydrogenase E1 component
MPPDLWSLYGLMLKSRLFEEASAKLWHEGLISDELSAVVLEAGISYKYARLCTQRTIPYARHLEDQILPNSQRICARARQLMQ